MSRTLVLIRHGKAQERTEGLPDERRALTDAGSRALAARLPCALELLKAAGSGRTAEVWSSPAVRARQTAEEAARILGCPDVRICPSLWEQDEESFLREAADSHTPCVVAVGHSPFVGSVAERLSGAVLPFSTGAVAALELPDGFGAPFEDGGDGREGGPARLLWFVQGPQARRWETLCALERELARAADNVAGRMEAFRENPDDVEALHKLRVSIRTARSLAAFCSPYLKASQSKEIQRDLRAVVLETSDLRELDVLAAQVHELESPSEDLLKALDGARSAERDRLVASLSSPSLKKALNRAVANARSIRWKSSVAQGGLAPRRLRERFASMEAELERGLESVDFGDHDATHKLRKRAKRVRYVAERFPDLLGDVAERAAKEAKAVQDRLGALCDARVNRTIARGFPTDGLSEGARRNLDEIAERSEALIREQTAGHGGA